MTKQNSFYIESLDGLRGLAVLMILFFHYNLIPYNSVLIGLDSIVKFGQTGVTLFFVLSGFLITRILLKSKSNKYYFQNFYIRRTLRIFPLYYLFLILTYFIFPLLNIGETPAFSAQLPFYLFYQNVSITFNWNWSGPFHYWSLAVEEHFYLFWPFVIYIFSVKRCYQIIALILIISFFSRWILFSQGYEVFYFTLCRMDSLAIGSFLALKEYQSNYKVSIQWRVPLIILSVGLIMFGYLWLNCKDQSNLYIQLVKDLMYSYVYIVLIAIIVEQEKSMIANKIDLIFQNKILLYCGKISFSLYVFHGFCYQVISFLEIHNFYLSIAACFLFSFVVASISYYYFEKPFLKLKDRFSN